jgi:hypothetical protein
MQYYDHGLVGATLAVAVGTHRRAGWAAVGLAALAAMFPDWDAATKRSDPAAYQRGHRVWGHNLFAVMLAGAVLGAAGYLIHQSWSHRRARPPGDATGGMRAWVGLGISIMLSHPLLDLLYCGVERDADWPVGLFWPVVGSRLALPWMPWSDWGATVILSAGLCLCLLMRQHAQRYALASLLILTIYVGIRGAVLHWG